MYINDKALCVVGDRIELVRQRQHQQQQQQQQRPPHRCYANRNIKLSVEAPEGSPGRSKRTQTAADNKRKTFKLNVKEFRNYQVCSRQLRQIYETVEVGDFERILRSLYVSEDGCGKRQKSGTEDVVARIRPDEVYEHFFGRHYAHLRDVVDGSERGPTASWFPQTN